ncbi:hypothetical protein BDN70DRAFT_871722 [Pholiota conissans]|uniref:Uncharacterized protein n=1 Tax=Pholiota conissans TaxID=109636 RepID=A0A9P5ZDL5_9AGAR|nr:hypothetical protein BDN70DRAFT_871722 [Pholiota conissans]
MASPDDNSTTLQDTGASLNIVTEDVDSTSTPQISHSEEELSTRSSTLSRESSEDLLKDPTTQTTSTGGADESTEPSISMNSDEIGAECEQDQDERDPDDADSNSDSDDDFPRFDEDGFRGRIAKPVSGQKPPPRPK